MAMVPNVLLPNFIPFALNADPHKCLVNPFTLDLDDLTLVGAKDIGTKAGGIYEDRAGSKWYVKVTEDLNIPEFLTSRVLQYLVPRNTSPVYFIKGKPGWVASKEIPGFRSQIDTVSRGKTIEDELKLTIALDFVRYIDRIRGNLGYIIDEQAPRHLIAACVDYDLGFRFFWPEDHKTVWFSLSSLDQLQEAVEVLESYQNLSEDDLLDYVDALIGEAEKNKGPKCNFDLLTFREVVQTRLEKMKEALIAAKELNAFIQKPERLTPEQLKKLDSHAHVLFKDKPTLLHLAASSGKGDLVDALIKSGANLNAVDGNHAAPLLRAIEADQTEIARMLLKAGANPEQTVHERPLHLAIKRDNVVLARELSTTYPYKKWMLIDKALECKSGKIIRELAPQWMLDAAPVQRKYLEDLMQKP